MAGSKILAATLLVASSLVCGQGFAQNSSRNARGQSQDYQQNHEVDRSARNGRSPSNFNKGLRDGGHGGQYYDPRHEQDGYNDRFRQNNGYDQQRQGGIGHGKGAIIGGAGGAVLGAIFGGGLKGTIIGGAAGAGIGAAVGDAKQNNRRQNDDYRH
jgi:hypothetical protein